MFYMAGPITMGLFSCGEKNSQENDAATEGETADNTSLSEKDRMAIVSDAKQMLDQYFDAIKKDGLKGEFKYLDDSPEFYWVPPGYTTAIPYDSVAAVLTGSANKYSSIDNNWVELTIVPLTPFFASYTGKVHSRIVFSSGEEMATDLMETGVLVKRKEGWKLLSGQTSVISQ